MANDGADQRNWDEPPPLELPGVLNALTRLPRSIQGGALAIWWIIAAVTYRSLGMAGFSAALLSLASLIALIGALLLLLWTRRRAWRDLEREELWRVAGWAATGAIILCSLPAVVFPLLVLLVLAIYAVTVLPLQLLR